MKIKITYEDAVNFIKNNMTGVTGVEIEAAVMVQGMNYLQGLNQALNEFPAYRSNQKISAIKRMRELVAGLGLAEAKYAVENPERARKEWNKSGRPYIPR